MEKRKAFMNVCGKDIKIKGRLIRVACVEGDTYEFVDDPELMLQGLLKSGVRIDLFTFLQKLPETSPKFRYPMEWHNLAVLPVSTFDHWWTHQIRTFPRNRARKAEKSGVVVRELPFDEILVQGIWEMYTECPVRQGRPFTHFGKDLETVRKEAATFLDRSIWIGAYLGERLIGFAKLTCDETRTQAGVVHILSMMQHRDRAPTNALIAQAVRSCAARGIAYLVYGSTVYGRKHPDSLANFKEINGFSRIDVPRYYVPLTGVGRTAFKLGMHHKFIDHLPEPILGRLREIRNSWYNRKLQPSTEAS
jgi:hypothetical protein